MRRVLLPLIALLMAGAATFGIKIYLADAGGPETARAASPKPRKEVLVAAQELSVGSFIQPDNLRWQEWPDVAVPGTYLVRGVRDDKELVGAVVRRPIGLGDPLADGSFVKPGDRGFLAAVLDPGMRAVSVPVDEASGNAGLVFPGDRVDLILTQTIKAADDKSGDRRVSETVLENVRVIAIGRSLEVKLNEGAEGGKPAKTATLEATPAAAEKVALVSELGKLALSLRSLAAADVPPPVGTDARVTWDSDVSPALRPENQPHSSLAVIRGDKVETVSVRRGAGS